MTRRWSDAIAGRHPATLSPGETVKVGVLPGEGVGPEVTAAAAGVLSAVAAACQLRVELRDGPPAGRAKDGGGRLTDAASEFCRDVFATGGAILAGAHGGRWVYELRRRFDLFCRISPLEPCAELAPVASTIAPRTLRGVDVVVVREQAAGVYQGRWAEADGRREGHLAEHSFSYTAREVQRIVDVAVELAERRRGGLAVIVKDGGLPSISSLWRRCAEDGARPRGLRFEALDVDFAAYRLVRDPRSFDVIVAPNLFGDVLTDVGGALLGSRGLGYGGSFDGGRSAVYQTNHGAAHDLAGADRANPGGQILSAAMMLRESFGLRHEAELVEEALAAVWRAGWRTDDLSEPGCRAAGTREVAELTGRAVRELAGGGRAPVPRASPPT